MPKKTRKEKIIARLRHELGKNQEQQVPTSPITNYKLQITNSVLPPKPAITTLKTKSISYIVHDLKKTLFLSGLAILIEFIVYWLWR